MTISVFSGAYLFQWRLCPEVENFMGIIVFFFRWLYFEQKKDARRNEAEKPINAEKE